MSIVTYFVDTSALFKRYVFEQGSSFMDQIFSEKSSVYISTVTLCEIISNLRRLVDIDNLISEKEFTTIKAAFLADIGNEIIDIVDLTPSIILKSLDICSDEYVTPLDSIQLSTALSMAEKPVFVCSDRKLLRLAAKWGLQAVNPA
ncbi:MAG: type II toxin-antitoxin system VapC family toxin [Dethiobacter sp.]|jgi:predicted nucleic acid-binding protein|nr:type II toxin-antitoxin system VapC family toxin [Dethiobacter sp.]